MKVLKFGGTSVGTSESLKNVKAIVEGLNEKAVVIVSALGGLTDKLISTARMAADGNCGYREEMEGIRLRHHNIVNEVIEPAKREEVFSLINPLLDELERNYDGISLIGALPDKTLDVVVSFGERISSIIVSRLIKNARHFNSLEYIKTEKWFNKNIADAELTDSLIRQTFNSEFDIAVAGGFISTDRESGEITNLGRGGSDYTAALIAASMNASVLEIWTDVDGFMTADPRIIPGAYVVNHMTFIESMELCSFGAKVIYPPTIYPVFHKNIPIRILNTFHPEAAGTWITDSSRPDDIPIKGISAVRNTSLVEIWGEYASNVAEINSRSFNALAKNGVNVFLVKQPDEDEQVFAFAVGTSDLENALKVVEEEFAPEITSGQITETRAIPELATLALVGENIHTLPRVKGRLFNTLQRDGIDVLASSAGASQTTISFVIAEADVTRALQLAHQSFF
ncbi:MAG: aspartate kinase [Prevotella sp.]|nr:aspartate kinase [Bacteroides sp.]MCM1366642.1 aspartate kinase [Prevotella sp.]MCM1437007.1 aspartate kinase [Prevotella sp.]